MTRVLLLTAGALIGFAANSLFTRATLGAGRIDPASFTAIRLITAALTLKLIASLTAEEPRAPASGRGSGNVHLSSGDWDSATALGGYAIVFTLAYTRIGAAVGALVLFGSVQVTMIGVGLV